MEIEERATARIGTADLEVMVEEAVKARGYKIVSGLKNSTLTGIKLELELIRVAPKGGNGGGLLAKSHKRQQKAVAVPDEHPL